MPSVSIVIPLYNKEKYIRRAVDSVLAQTFRDFELFVVNDGSTDSGPAFAREYDDPRIHVIDQENQGVSAARNRGIAEARGELMAFLDADDEWLPDFLARSLEAIQSLGLDWSLTRWVGVHAESCLHRYEQPSPSRGSSTRAHFFQLCCSGILCPVGSLMLRRQIFSRIGGFNEGITHGEDIEMWWRIGLHFPYVAYDPSVLMIYHLSADGRATNRPRTEEKLVNFWQAVTSFNESVCDTETLRLFRNVRDRFADKAIRGYLLGGYRIAARCVMRNPSLRLSPVNKFLLAWPFGLSQIVLSVYFGLRDLLRSMRSLLAARRAVGGR